ncbi:MAG: MBL fold metallo-hydrolase [Clostridia bacterium]|nr:MBL fold metallo-hydrolase [Clostridia bacterium]
MLSAVSVKNTLSRLSPHQIAMWYLGQVGFLFAYRQKTVLVDGYLSDYVDRNCSSELVPWKRLYPAPMDAHDLSFVDYVLCTHTHYDHTDPDTLSALLSVNTKAVFLGTHAVARRFAELGVPAERIRALDNDETVSLCNDITVTNVPAAHEELHPDEAGQYEEGGFRLLFGDGEDAVSVYHAGDCCLWDGLEKRIRNTDILILPVNGRDYYRRYEKGIIGNFDCTEAITLAKNTGAELLIPVHIDLYKVNQLNPAIFVDTLEGLNPAQKYHIFRPGEKYIYER